jgi:hypothetical protein
VQGIRLSTGLAAAAAALALAAPASAQFLPENANYTGKTNHGGKLEFQVRNHRLVFLKGEVPLPKGQTCKYADRRRLPVRIPEDYPITSSPFTIRVTQRINPGTTRWRRFEWKWHGQFSSDAQTATGTIRAKEFDSEGKCKVRDDLSFHISR